MAAGWWREHLLWAVVLLLAVQGCSGLFVQLAYAQLEGEVHGASPTMAPLVDITGSLMLATSSDTSLNWSGYVAEGATYSGVSGTWIVPEARGSGLAADATWVGIGGVGNARLIQAGTQAVVHATRTEYQAWIETLPDDSVPLPIAVRPGDQVSVAITETAPDLWLVSLTNRTTHTAYQTTLAYHASHASAEWVEELPSTDFFIPLDRFGSARFLSATAVANGRTASPRALGARALTMVGAAGSPLALPSVLSASGDSFRVTRAAAEF